jgi:hypothetical protein
LSKISGPYNSKREGNFSGLSARKTKFRKEEDTNLI